MREMGGEREREREREREITKFGKLKTCRAETLLEVDPTGELSFTWVKFSLVLVWPSVDWMRTSHLIEGNHLYSGHCRSLI